MLKNLIIIVTIAISGCSSIAPVNNGESLDDYFNRIKFSGSILVAKEGKIIHLNSYGFANKDLKIINTPQTQFLLGSTTKQFTALAIMQLQEQGKLALSDSIARYLPDFPQGSRITIKQLLTHTSGLYNFTDRWNEIAYQQLSPKEIVESFKNEPLKFAPGSRVSYSNSGYIIAGMIIEKVSGLSYENYIQKHIFNPLNMNHSSYGLAENANIKKAIGYRGKSPLNPKKMSDIQGAGALASTVEDLYLWDQSFYSHSIISKNSLPSIFINEPTALGLGSGKRKVITGLGWLIYQTKFGPEYFHGGYLEGFSSSISRYPEQKSVIIILSNKDQYNAWSLKNRIANTIFKSNE